MQIQQRKLLALLIFIMGLGVSIFLIDWYNFLKTPLVPSNTSLVYIFKPGASIKTLAFDLTKLTSLKKPYYLIFLAYIQGDAKKLKAGEYEFSGGTTPKQLLAKIVSGKVVLHELTFIEGWTFSQIMNTINTDPYLQHTLTNLTNEQIISKLGIPDSHPEGLFFPDTYKFTLNTPDAVLLQKAYQMMQEHLNLEWQNRMNGLSYQRPYEALIVASMIEKETAKLEERPIIAGVLLRRLQKNMLLQIDPTVIYGMGSRYTGNITKADLLEDTPYNTYVHHGLPPTPICMPSLASIQAALHPAEGDALYFVSKGDGSHQFSATLENHIKAVSAYQSKLKDEASNDKRTQ